MNIWLFYLLVYACISLGYLAFRNLLWMKNDFKKESWEDAIPDDYFSVVIPFFNEDMNALRSSIQSVIDADGHKEIILVDDGSEKKDCTNMVKREFGNKVKLFILPVNKGKREAQKVGFENCKGEIIVTMDSDTVVLKDSFIELLKPFQDEEVGASTGNLRVSNEKHNFLTKIIASSYWYANEGERYSLSSAGVVTCCSGVLSAYRRPLVDDVMQRYVNQKIFGKICNHGDDRHMTNLMLEKGFKTVFTKKAVCYTEAPTTFSKFLKQQLRWKKSFIIETPYTLKFAWKRSKILFMEVMFDIAIPILIFPSRVVMVLSMIFFPIMIPLVVMSVLTFCILRNLKMWLEERRLLPYAIGYAFVNEFVLYWLFLIAPIQVLRGDNKWGTR